MKTTPTQKKLYELIDEILWTDWDPIGVNDIEDARYEYQGYTPHIFSLKIQDADKTKIAEHLYTIETINMGMQGDKNRCMKIALKIIDTIA